MARRIRPRRRLHVPEQTSSSVTPGTGEKGQRCRRDSVRHSSACRRLMPSSRWMPMVSMIPHHFPLCCACLRTPTSSSGRVVAGVAACRSIASSQMPSRPAQSRGAPDSRSATRSAASGGSGARCSNACRSWAIATRRKRRSSSAQRAQALSSLRLKSQRATVHRAISGHCETQRA